MLSIHLILLFLLSLPFALAKGGGGGGGGGGKGSVGGGGNGNGRSVKGGVVAWESMQTGTKVGIIIASTIAGLLLLTIVTFFIRRALRKKDVDAELGCSDSESEEKSDVSSLGVNSLTDSLDLERRNEKEAINRERESQVAGPSSRR